MSVIKVEAKSFIVKETIDKQDYHCQEMRKTRVYHSKKPAVAAFFMHFPWAPLRAGIAGIRQS